MSIEGRFEGDAASDNGSINMEVLEDNYVNPDELVLSTDTYSCKCRCGEVEFHLIGRHILSPNCCCNDCVTAAYFVDEKAKAAGVENISCFEQGNNQAAAMVYWPSKNVKYVKGKDKIVRFKLRESSTSYRSYTSCCYTTVIAKLGAKLKNANIGIAFNRNCMTPPYRASNYAKINEIVNKSEFAGEATLRIVKSFTWGGWGKFLKAKYFGGGACDDEETQRIICRRIAADVEVAGKAAYEACHFDTKHIDPVRKRGLFI